MKKRFIIMLFAICLVLTMTPLASPFAYADGQITGVKISGNTLSWDPYEGATRYSVCASDDTINISVGFLTSTSVNLQDVFDSTPYLLSGKYHIYVDAYKGEEYIQGSTSFAEDIYEYTAKVASYPAPEFTVGTDYIVRWKNTAPEAVPYIDIQYKDEFGWHTVTYLDKEGAELYVDTWLEPGTTSYYVGQYLDPDKTYRVLLRFEPADGVTGIKNSPDVCSAEFTGPSVKVKYPVINNVSVDSKGYLTWDTVDLQGITFTYQIVVSMESDNKIFTSDMNTGFYLLDAMDGADMPDGEYQIVIYPYVESEKLAIYNSASDPTFYNFERIGKGSTTDPDISNTNESYDISKAKLSIKNVTWTGKARKPSVVVTLDGVKLKKDTNYKVSYKNNRNVGKATVIVTGINDYAGTASKSFKINPKGTSLKSVKAAKKALTIKWKKQSKAMSKKRITGYQIWVSTSKKFTKKTTKKINVKGYKKTSAKVTGLKANKKYYVKIRTYKKIGKVTYYSPWSKSIVKKIL